MAQSEKDSNSKKPRWENNKINNQVLTLRKHIVSRVNSFFSKQAATQLPKLN